MMTSSSPTAGPPAPTLVLTVGQIPRVISEVVERWVIEQQWSAEGAGLSELERAVRARTVPALVLLAATDGGAEVGGCLSVLKHDGRLQSVPAVVFSAPSEVATWLNAGADDAVSVVLPPEEIEARLTAAVRRARRDIHINPSTRLAGSDAIAGAIAVRIARGELFAACYADLDHFKEFNDRSGYAMGDDVIRSVASLLVETVHEMSGTRGFVGHIGGDDFLFLVPLEDVDTVCDALVQRADESLPLRYSAHDRQAGYFFGKDRRGRLDRVPLMTLSIGVVTNERRRFTGAAQVSELATEMKTYAKSLPGSVWAVDRRSDGEPVIPPQEKHQ